MNPIPQASTGLTGYALVSVIDHEGKTVRELPPIRNLWLDQGLDALARVLIADAFGVCVKGSGQDATKEAIHASNTYTLAGNTLTRNATPGTPRDFVPGDVGKLFRSANGRECMIAAFTDATHVDVTGVGLNAIVTFATQTGSFYNVNLTGLTTEAFTTVSGSTIDKVEGSTTVTASGPVFTAVDVGRAIFVGGDPSDPYADRYTIVAYVSTTEITVDREAGEFTARRLVVYTPQVGDPALTPLSRTSATSAVAGENSTTDTAVGGVLTGERQLKRTFIFPPEPEYIEYRSTDDAGTFTWNGTNVTRTAGARNFVAADVGKYMKFDGGQFCKITVRNSNTSVTVDRAPTATITNGTLAAIYGFASYDGIAFSDSDDPDANANIIVRLESAGVVTPVLVASPNPELPGQQLKVTYICKATVGPVAITARANAGITDSANVMGSNKFGTSVVEGLALCSIDAGGDTQSSFAVLEPSVAGYMGLSPVAVALQPLKLPDRSAGAATTELAASGYVDGTFSQLYEGTFGINDAIAINWRSLGIVDGDNAAFAFTWLFEANQAKNGQVIIVIRFRKSWNRDLS